MVWDMKRKTVKKILIFVTNLKSAVIFIHVLIKAVMLSAHASQVLQVRGTNTIHNISQYHM